MKMPYLPSDLVEEILSRVPARSLKRLQTTCKRWNVLFKDQRFLEKHLRKASKESLPLMLKEYRVYSLKIKLNVVPPSLEFKGPLDKKESHSKSQQVDIVKVLHCDGLLLCTTKDDRLLVWHPCLGETRWIQPKTSYYYTTYAIGYKNNKYCHSYKILKCYVLEDVVCGYEIFEFSSGSWRSLLDEGKIEIEFGYTLLTNDAVSLKGNTYWFGFDSLLRFDFTIERFERLCLPHSTRGGTKCLSVVGQEQLSVLDCSFYGSELEIWLSSRIDSEAALLWTKYFTVDLLMRNIHMDPVSFFLDEEEKLVVCSKEWSSPDRKKVFIIGADDNYHTDFSFARLYVPISFLLCPKFGSNPLMKLGDYMQVNSLHSICLWFYFC